MRGREDRQLSVFVPVVNESLANLFYNLATEDAYKILDDWLDDAEWAHIGPEEYRSFFEENFSRAYDVSVDRETRVAVRSLRAYFAECEGDLLN